MTDQPAMKAIGFVLVSAESIEDGRGWMDRLAQALAADKASQGQRYRGVYRNGYHAGADAAFAALLAFLEKGGRVGLPMGPHSLHVVNEQGATLELMSLLALRPFSWDAE